MSDPAALSASPPTNITTTAESDVSNAAQDSNTQQLGGYPEQKHAGAVGYGPGYGKGAGFSDKFEGLKEQVKGKITKNPDLVEHGHELQTGELKKKQLEDDNSAFSNAGDKGDAPKETGSAQTSGAHEQAATVAPEGTAEAEAQRRGEAH